MHRRLLPAPLRLKLQPAFEHRSSGDRHAKGVLTWSNCSGKPEFTFDLYIQKRADTRGLTTFSCNDKN